MRRSELSIEVDGTREAVFEYVLDPRKLADWVAQDGQGVVTGDEKLVLGSTYTVSTGESSKRTFEYEVIGLEQPSFIAVKTEGSILTYSSRLTFEEQDGQTTVKDVIEMDDPSGIFKLLGGWMMGRVEKTHQERLDRLGGVGANPG
jgi:uncharacterized protein YndB with AHSA1/START domain